MQNMTEEINLPSNPPADSSCENDIVAAMLRQNSSQYGPEGRQCMRAERKDHARSFSRPQVHYNSSLGQRGNATKSCLR